jgi:hypothetical protein
MKEDQENDEKVKQEKKEVDMKKPDKGKELNVPVYVNESNIPNTKIMISYDVLKPKHYFDSPYEVFFKLFYYLLLFFYSQPKMFQFLLMMYFRFLYER